MPACSGNQSYWAASLVGEEGVWYSTLSFSGRPSPHGEDAAVISVCSPQGVVLQQDTYIEDQKLALSEKALSRSFFRPASLLEQEKQRNLEKQRQELANLKKQQTQHQEERRRREKEWEVREKELAEHEAELAQREEQVQRLRQELEREREELQVKKAAYQLDLERLRTAQKQLEREKVQLKQDVERFAQMRQEPDHNQVNDAQ